jgi:hypothetical protein
MDDMKQVNTEDRKNARCQIKKNLVHPWLKFCSLGLEFCSDEDSFNTAAHLGNCLLSQRNKKKQNKTNCVYLRQHPVVTAAIILIRLNISSGELCIIYIYN